MSDLEIIQNIFGNNDVSEKWLINMFDVCKSVREAEREACAKLCEESDRYRGEYFAQLIRSRGQV